LRWRHEKRAQEDQVQTENPHRLLKEKQRQERAAFSVLLVHFLLLQKNKLSSA
jgi:hypothetical protein